MARLYLIRHGEASPPSDLRLPTRELTLTNNGRRQIRALAERLHGRQPLRGIPIYASDLPRALETAQILGTVLRPGRGSTPAIVRDLREVDFGDWSGRSYAELIADPAEAEAASRFFADVTQGAPPNGESADAVARRVHDALGTIAAAHPEEGAIVVGHAGSLRLALALGLGLPLAAYWRLRLDYASLSVVDWTEWGVVVERLNELPPPDDTIGEGLPDDRDTDPRRRARG